MIMNSIKSNEYLNELIFTYFLFSFVLLKPLNNYFNKYSTIILLINVIAIMFLNFKKNKPNMKKFKFKVLILILSILLINLIDSLFRYNEYSLKYIYDFFIYSIIPVYLFSYVDNYKKVLKYYSNFCIITFFIYFLDPILGYPISSNYMNFGLIAMLPTFIGLHMYRNLFNINKFLCIELISFIELVIFANKGAIISAILFIAIVKIINFKYIRYKLIKIISYIFIVLLILLNLEKILIMLQSLAIKYGFSSYSLNTLLAYLEIGNNISLNSRVELWENAYKMFCEKPILGNGVGSYQSNFGIYTHNIFLDVLVFYGFIGFFILFYFIFKSLKKINTSDIYFKYFGYITFTLWFPTLLLSSNFYVNYYFWIFIILGFRKRIVN